MQVTAPIYDLEKGTLLPKTPIIIPFNYNGRKVEDLTTIEKYKNLPLSYHIATAICTALCFAGCITWMAFNIKEGAYHPNTDIGKNTLLMLVSIFGVLICGGVGLTCSLANIHQKGCH